MGDVVSTKASVARIEQDVRAALRNATSRKGEIEAAAIVRLAPAVTAIDSTKAILGGAVEAEAAAWSSVLAADDGADLVIGQTRDAMWNKLGRPQRSAQMDHVYPGGVGTYAGGAPEGQPVLMQVLHARILSAEAVQWTGVLKAGWAADIEAARVPYAAAVEAHRPVDAALTVAEASYRATVRAGQARLTSFKRDLRNLGMSEAQVHEIIPDAGSAKSPPKEAPVPPAT